VSDARIDGPGDERTDHTDAMHPPAGDPVEHLWNAAHEFSPPRGRIDRADAVVVEHSSAPPSPATPRLRRIDVE
jgi:hypothetical protein